VKPLHLLCVMSLRGGLIGAELTVLATGDCFPLLGFEVRSEPQYEDVGNPILEVVFFHRELIVELELGALLLAAIPHSTHDRSTWSFDSARLALDWSEVEMERIYV
jgi:hypothetical protein